MHTRTDRRGFLGLAGGAVLGLATPRLAAAAAGRPLNVVFILADDLGWADTSLTGSRFYQTPNVERLARRGVYFSDAYAASPLCSPTRASILTGLSPARIGITSPACHLPEEVLEASLQERAPATAKVLNHRTATRLKLEYVTLAEALKRAGYATGHFGKWHLGPEPYDPLHQGFDVDIPHWSGPGPAGSYVAPWKFPGFSERTPGEHIEDRMGDEAVAFMEQHRDRPFFLNYWQFSVHAPFNAKADLIEAYRAKADPASPQRSPTYAAMVQSMDENLGKILDALDRLGIADNTLVVFFSDNGGNMYNTVDGTTPTSNAPLRGGKATLYEGGTRVPCIVVWPGVTRPGSTSPTVIQSVDFHPTLLEILGLAPQPGQAFDGVSIVPALRGGSLEREAIYCFFPHSPQVPDWLPPGVYVRRGEWKLIRIFHDGYGGQHRYELYNLHDDPGETRNLASAHPERVHELDALIEGFLVATTAVVPKPNPAYRPEARGTIGGWQAGGNGHAELAAKDGCLQITVTGGDPMILTAERLDVPAGTYAFEVRLRSAASGSGLLFCAGPAKQVLRGTGTPFAITHDDTWHDYRIEVSPKEPIGLVRLDPATGAGVQWIEWLRLRRPDGSLVKEWTFGPQAGTTP